MPFLLHGGHSAGADFSSGSANRNSHSSCAGHPRCPAGAHTAGHDDDHSGERWRSPSRRRPDSPRYALSSSKGVSGSLVPLSLFASGAGLLVLTGLTSLVLELPRHCRFRANRVANRRLPRRSRRPRETRSRGRRPACPRQIRGRTELGHGRNWRHRIRGPGQIGGEWNFRRRHHTVGGNCADGHRNLCL